MRSLSFRQLVKILRKHDKQFVIDVARGKGSHRGIYHPDVDGNESIYTMPCHNEGADIKPVYLRGIKSRFNLPDDIFD